VTNQVRQIAYRLKSEGKVEVQRDFADIKTAATQAYDAAAAATDRATTAAERAEKRWLAMAQAGREAHAAWQQQQKLNALLGVDRTPSASARESAAIFEAEAEAFERAQAKAALLKAQIDPLGAAQARLNAEIAEYNALAAKGLITKQEQIAAEALARKRLDETTAALGRQSAGLTRLEKASRLNLVRQGADVAVTAAMGMNPAMIAIQQGPQILDAMATSGIRASAALLGVSAAVAVVGGAVIAAGVAHEKYARSVLAVEAAADGLGRAAGMTGQQVIEMAEESARAGEISEKAAREQAVAYLNTGKVGIEVLDRLIERGRDYQVTFGEEAAASTRRLADAMADPARAAATWGVEIGAVDTATLRLIESMQRQNDLTGAQMVLLDALEPRLLKHKDYATDIESAWDAVGRAIGTATDRLGKFLYVTDEERIATLEKSLPYMIGGEAIRGREELARLRSEQSDRQRRLQANAEEKRRTAAEAASRTAYDRVFPEDSRIRQLQADRSRFVADSTDPKRSAAEQARAREAIAATDRQISALEKKKDGATRSSGRHAAALARETESLEANARGALSAAEAYLKSSADGMKAEAARTAATRAARSGADADLRIRQQLTLVIAEQASAGAKAVAEMEDETASRRRLNDAVASGAMTAEAAARQLTLENQLRPMTIALTLAEGEAKTALQQVIDRLTRSYGDLNAERAREALLADTAATRRSIALMETELRLVRATDEDRAVAIARQQAEQELDAKGVPRDSAEGRAAISAAEDEARTRARLSRAQYAADTVRDQQEALALAAKEAEILRTDPRHLDARLARERLILELQRQKIDATSAEGREILDNFDKLKLIEQQLERSRAAWDIIEDTGSRTLDRFGDLIAKGEDDWDAWKQAGLDAIQEIIAEMIKLWAINPLKNWLFGQNNPTGGDMGGVFGSWIGDIFGGAGGGAGDWTGTPPIFSSFARGTESAPGGWSWVGEEGPELRYLPAGAKIRSTGSSIDMLRAALRGGGQAGAIHLSLGGVTVDARGADPAAARRIEGAVDALRNDLPALAVAAVREAYGRRQLRFG
jgi:hypothetical protein